jgi:hypothetical protein
MVQHLTHLYSPMTYEHLTQGRVNPSLLTQTFQLKHSTTPQFSSTR